MPFWIPFLIGAGIAGVAFTGGLAVGAAAGYYYGARPMYPYPVQYYPQQPYYGMQFYPAYY